MSLLRKMSLLKEMCLREEKSIYDLIGTGVETFEIIKSKKYFDDIDMSLLRKMSLLIYIS